MVRRTLIHMCHNICFPDQTPAHCLFHWYQCTLTGKKFRQCSEGIVKNVDKDVEKIDLKLTNNAWQETKGSKHTGTE